MCNAKISKRITGLQTFNYSDKVLIGSWFQERYEAEQKKSCKKPIGYSQIKSSYETDFMTPSPLKNRLNLDNMYWENRYRGMGIPFDELLGQGIKNQFIKNQSTIYDLAFHHKVNHFLDINAQNLTKTGLGEAKQYKWADETTLNEYTTTYNTHFLEYPEKCVLANRKSRYKDVEVKVFKHGNRYFPVERVPTKIIPAI